jgi:type I restriction enzyme R subunit
VTPHGFTEDQLVERPALEVLKTLGWTVVSAAEEVFGAGGTLGRETPGDTVLLPRLEAALRSLNPALPTDAISGAVHALTRDRLALSLVAANREVWELLRDGVAVTVHDHVHGGQRTERVRAVNWEDPAANDFLAVSQMTVTGSLYTRRADVIGFVNGLPLVVIELKKPGQPTRQAYDGNLTSYKSDIP